MWPHFRLAGPLFWSYVLILILNCCLCFPFRPQIRLEGEKPPRNVPFVMLWSTFVPSKSKIPNTLHIRIYQNSVPLIGNATCHFFFIELLDYTVTEYTFFPPLFFFLRKRTWQNSFFCALHWHLVVICISFFSSSKCCDWMLMTPRSALSFLGLSRHCCFALCSFQLPPKP